MILIISFLDNAHVERVTRHLTRDYEIVDLSWFPKDMRMHAMISPEVDAMALDLPHGRRLDLDEVGAVWHRRIRPFELDPALTEETARSFAWSEAAESLPGLWYGMDCFWMNPPDTDERAMKKVYQHRLAAQLGLRVPETLVTNDPETARAFVEPRMASGVIRKAFRNHPSAPRQTLKVGPAELELIDTVRFTPVIFQEYIPVALDLRVTVVDGEIFTASFRSDPQYDVDYRAGIGTAEVAPYQLPDDITDKLREFMKRLGLAFGAVDFRVTPEGEHVFFEVNPAGEYLFVSDRIDLPIPQAIAATLERHDAAHSR
ncbi:MvdC/MvdD family ATP grasp protein [Roseovarius aestuariivivens]|uniref:MvdC/MvdD family ATP grasp protein n=1 Tax=Roseovarius aestuariivivens TaxID=1888910 RepID=UPI0010820E70|nr:hypothetical protein [Roseovarius aestuariivivens]